MGPPTISLPIKTPHLEYVLKSVQQHKLNAVLSYAIVSHVRHEFYVPPVLCTIQSSTLTDINPFSNTEEI